ncbi:hypothetical protein [Flavihumibacter fluvii]|uniref:hypothetical protein n=1 Tax=Flavihumibacter fluvii TaxID=2838157 RepID=UPI001BDE89DB|nr:hypothetical protein [Flavihumibacter fluvii]ULQ53234.1 hypothetical protein KJS93_02755 [Flavihumibacter fluvii]
MPWQEIDTDRFLDDGVQDKSTGCLIAMLETCRQKGLPAPTTMEFINQFQRALLSCGKVHFIEGESHPVITIMAGFIDRSKLLSGSLASPAYTFMQSQVCEALSAMAGDYQSEFRRKPYLQEIMAAFSRSAVGRPEYYFSDGGNMPLAYITAIDKPI